MATDSTTVGRLLARTTPALAWLDQAGRIVCLVIGATLGIGYAVYGTRPIDASIYWDAGHAAHYYGTVWTQAAGYVYPPPLAQITGVLPWSLFIALWMILIFASLWYATRWLSAPLLVVAAAAWLLGLAPVASPLTMSVIGNPQTVVAAAIVLGFRHPAAWGFVLLTKIGPGIGLVWFAVRREWRALAIALGVSAIVAAVSLALSAGAWMDFARFAVGNYATTAPVPVVAVPLVVRIPIALILVTWGALTDRPWTVPIAAGWSALALYEASYVVVWAAAVPLFVTGLTERYASRATDADEQLVTAEAGAVPAA